MRTALIGLVLIGPLIAQGDRAPSVAKVLEDLGSKNYQTQRLAVLAARKTKNPAILDRLLHLAQHARHPNIRGYAGESLGHYRDPRIFPVLLKAAVEGPLSTRMGALPGLGLLGDVRSYAVLVGVLKDRMNWSYAATGLRHLGDKRGAGALARIFRKHLHDHAVFGAVAETILALDPDIATDLFFAAILDERLYRHHRLDRLLGQIKTKAVREQAQKLLERDNNKETDRVRACGVHILGQVGDVATVAVLLRVMDSDETLRLVAIRALGDLGHELAVPQISRHLEAESAPQRAVVAEALGKIGHDTAVRSLLVALRGEAETIPKLRMIEALGRIGDRRAVAELGKHLDDATMQEQPMRLSSIRPYPLNVPVNWVAWWAIRYIRDAKPPQPIQKLFTFHGRGTQVARSDIEAARKWWQQQRDKAGFSLDK